MSAPGLGKPDEVKVDVGERGANRQTSNRRLFMQLQAFGGCSEPKTLAAALEKSRIESALYADLQDPRGVGVLTFAEDPAFFVTRVREVWAPSPSPASPTNPS
jgi:chlorite dismutase